MYKQNNNWSNIEPWGTPVNVFLELILYCLFAQYLCRYFLKQVNSGHIYHNIVICKSICCGIMYQKLLGGVRK